MKNHLAIISLFIGSILIGCTQKASETETVTTEQTKIETQNFQSILDSIYEVYSNSLGILVHIESPKYGVSWSGSSGYSDLERKTKLQPDENVLIASSIKSYVSVAILRLQENGQLNIEDPISKHLTEKTTQLFKDDGYDVDAIKIKHLLSHTSGIADYVNDDYFDFINKNQKYRWTRDEQLKLATEVGNPFGKPQEMFKYGDVNFLLATEIIEQKTNEPFYTAMRNLLKYDELGLKHTYFPTLEEIPAGTKPLTHQYWNEKGWGEHQLDFEWDSKEHDVSWDLYGGGGIATNMKELAQFSHHLFNEKIITDKSTLELLITDVPTTDGIVKPYRLGIADTRIKGLRCFGHGGFWGTLFFYVPALDASIAVCVLERNKKMVTIKSLMDAFSSEMSNQLYVEDKIVDEDYTLYKSKQNQGTLVLFPGGGSTSKETQEEFEIIEKATSEGISVVLMNFNRHFWIDRSEKETLTKELKDIFSKHQLDTKNITIGGMSIGGNVVLSLSDYLIENNSSVAPKNVFIVDSPIDLYALYQSSLVDLANPNLDEERLIEPKFIVDFLEKEFSKDSLMENIQKVSPFVYQNNKTSVSNLKNCNVRFYTEPDSLWWQEIRQTKFENTNAYAIQKVVKNLQLDNWKNIELIETKNKGVRANGERHPHSWSIVDKDDLIEWVKK